MDKSAETAPAGFPMWARWLCLATFWPGVVWYLYYKLLVEDDLRYYRGLGIGGSLVIIPFALGLFAGPLVGRDIVEEGLKAHRAFLFGLRVSSDRAMFNVRTPSDHDVTLAPWTGQKFF
ncbi:nhaD [Symbiodinium pilosum]|uniref:NhaD protein n=1 Tax=Symbiodinium pilosum TaxID=2952 RepID=A0A812KLJ0_SYMPI|nr:nhaD [Symbiodinium pilosum]